MIDKADLADEEELERRRIYKKKCRRRKILHTSVALVVIAAILVGLWAAGVFDGFELEKYHYSIYNSGCFGGKAPVLKNIDEVKSIPTLYENETGVNNVDSDKLDNTIYDVVAEYCKENNYSVQGYNLIKCLSTADGKKLVCCVTGQCMDISKKDTGETWAETGYTYSSGAGLTGVELICGNDYPSWVEFDSTMHTNMYLACFVIVVDL